MKNTVLLAALFALSRLAGFVVINELYYDHPGTDAGYEWIEFYNLSPNAINLNGWKVEYAGSNFTLMFEFPEIIIPANGYLLVGDAEVYEADLLQTLYFQNGGSATDGVRLISPDSLWTDTILYDSPNTNELPDDTGAIGSSFAEDVPAGCSLARIPNGSDTNSGADWFLRSNPTPGSANLPEIDLTVLSAEIANISGICYLFTTVLNLSTEAVDNYAGSIDIYLNNQPFRSFELDSIAALEEIEYEVMLSLSQPGYHLTDVYSISFYDYNLSNNTKSASTILGKSPIALNELMIRPLENHSEWLEIYVGNNVDNLVDNLEIFDLTGTPHAWNAQGLTTGYFVLGANLEDLYSEYFLPIEKIIQTDGFPALNNSGDKVYIADHCGTVFDSLSYSSNAVSDQGISYERADPLEVGSYWSLCEDPQGHTAGYENSISQPVYDMELKFISIYDTESYINHNLLITNPGMIEVEGAQINCTWNDLVYTNSGNQYETIDFYEANVEYQFTTEILPESFYCFEYFLEVSQDSISENNHAESFYCNAYPAWIINEIMYSPKSGAPEWIEIKRNLSSITEDELVLSVGSDSSSFTAISEYFLVTGNEEDIDYLKAIYGEEIEIYCGLGSLNNEGDYLFLGDIFCNIFEQFHYEPAWNNEMSGISIERINPMFPPAESNWAQSLNHCTPGYINSTYMEAIPEKVELKIIPEVFCPRKGEFTTISFSNTEKLNRVKIRIYDLKGRSRRILVDNGIQGMHQEYIWNGKDDKGHIMPVGLYIILFESSDGKSNFKSKETVTISW